MAHFDPIGTFKSSTDIKLGQAVLLLWTCHLFAKQTCHASAAFSACSPTRNIETWSSKAIRAQVLEESLEAFAGCLDNSRVTCFLPVLLQDCSILSLSVAA